MKETTKMRNIRRSGRTKHFRQGIISPLWSLLIRTPAKRPPVFKTETETHFISLHNFIQKSTTYYLLGSVDRNIMNFHNAECNLRNFSWKSFLSVSSNHKAALQLTAVVFRHRRNGAALRAALGHYGRGRLQGFLTLQAFQRRSQSFLAIGCATGGGSGDLQQSGRREVAKDAIILLRIARYK